MANDKIDVIVGKQAFDQVAKLDKDLQGLIKTFTDLYTASQKMGGVGSSAGGSGGGGTAAAKKGLTELEKATEQLRITNEKLAISEEKIVKELARKREELRLASLRTKQTEQENSKLVGAYGNLSAKLNRLRKEYKDVAASEGVASANAKKLADQVRVLDAQLKKIDASAGQFQRNVGNYKDGFAGMATSLRSLMGAFGLASGIYLFANAVRDSFNRIKEFDAAMQNIAGIMRVNRDDVADLEKQIVKVAGSSVKTSNEVAKLAESLVTLGKTKSEIIDLLAPVNNLAIGLEATSDETAEFFVQTLNAFGASTKEAEKYADQIATIRTSTSLDFQKMRDSFQYLTPISRLLNKDLAYTGALIGVLADNGIKAESAGRLLGTAQQRLAKNGKTLSQALQEINEEQAKGVKEVDLLAMASKLFGAEAAKLGVILANNTEKLNQSAEAIRNNTGALKDLTDKQLESLQAKLLILDSTWEEFILGIENGTGKLSGFFKSLIEGTTNAIKALSNYNKTFDDFVSDAKESGKNEAQNFLNTTLNSSMSEENKIIAIEEFRLEKTREINKELQIRNELLKKEQDSKNKIAELEKPLTGAKSFNPVIIGFRKTQIKEEKLQLESFQRLIEKNAIKANNLREVLVSISEQQLSGIIQETDNIDTSNDKLDKASKKSLDNVKKQEDSKFKLRKFYLEQEIRMQEEIISDEESLYYERLEKLQEFTNSSIELAELEKDQVLKGLKDGSDEATLVWEQYFEKVYNINKDVANKASNLSFGKEIIDVSIQDIIQTPDPTTAVSALATILGVDPDALLEEWQMFVQEMEKTGKEASFKEFFDNIQEQAKEAKEQISRLGGEIGQEAGNFVDAVFENRAQRYEDEIQLNNDFYASLLNNERLSVEQRSQLEAERDAKNALLEKKKREEQRKQAIFNKVFGLAEVAVNTSVAITKAFAQLGTFAPTVVPFIIAQGALQAATIAATPIPRFRTGKKAGQGKDGVAMVNDGGKDEIKISADGTITRYTGRNVLDYVKQSDTIIPDANAFERAALMATINNNGENLSKTKDLINFERAMYGIKKEMQEGIKQGFKGVKLNVHNNIKTSNREAYINSKMN